LKHPSNGYFTFEGSLSEKVVLAPFWLGLAGGVLGSAGLWLLVTGLYSVPWSVYLGVATVLAGSVWDMVNAQRAAACAAAPVCEAGTGEAERPADLSHRVARGAALSVAAAAAFYGLYKSVDALAPEAEEGEIACWGINACKGTTACTTAFNACNGQNSCKGAGISTCLKKNVTPGVACLCKARKAIRRKDDR
jgi:hypothetical protein